MNEFVKKVVMKSGKEYHPLEEITIDDFLEKEAYIIFYRDTIMQDLIKVYLKISEISEIITITRVNNN